MCKVIVFENQKGGEDMGKSKGKPVHNFLVSVEGNRLYEIRTSRGLTIKKFLPMIGMKNKSTPQFCESIAIGRPLSKTLAARFPNHAITDTTAKKIADSLQMPVNYIFPEYDRCERENQRECIFHSQEERNEAITQLYSLIRYMILGDNWKSITCRMDYDDALDTGMLKLVEVANYASTRGLQKGTDFNAYLLKSVQNSLLRDLNNINKVKKVSFDEDDLTEKLASKNAFMSGISYVYDDPLDIVCAKETVRERLQTRKARATL